MQHAAWPSMLADGRFTPPKLEPEEHPEMIPSGRESVDTETGEVTPEPETVTPPPTDEDPPKTKAQLVDEVKALVEQYNEVNGNGTAERFLGVPENLYKLKMSNLVDFSDMLKGELGG